MSKHETPMTRWYWQQVGGTLIEEFRAVRGSRHAGLGWSTASLSKVVRS